MMKKKLLVLVAVMATLFAKLDAQTSKPNLLTNPSFETLIPQAEQHPEYKYQGWSRSKQLLLLDDAVSPKDGTRSLKIYPSAGGGYLSPVNDDLDLQTYAVNTAEAFTFSFWYRGTLKYPNLETEVRYYNSSDFYTPLRETIIPESSVTKPNKKSWTQKTVEIPVVKTIEGKTVTHIAVLLKVLNKSAESGDISIDLFSLTEGGLQKKAELPKPTGLRTSSFEREIELSWQKGIDADVSWELVHADKTYKTTVPKFILPNLEPNTEHLIKVCAVKGGEKSEYEERRVRTNSIFKDKSDDTRVPYLRTLAQNEGNIGKTLNLFYNNLYNGNAKFTYWIDGKTVTPNGYTLDFKTAGKHKLKVRVEESSNEIWFLNYNIDVTE